MNQLNFLLIGTSGNGISSLGNTLLGQKYFKTSNNLLSTDCIAVKGVSHREDCIITVVDIPGIDTDNKNIDALKSFKALIQEALRLCEDGFTAIVFVLQFCSRYTRQEQETLKLIKATLGESVITKSTICAFTHGDLYKHESESFETWCRSQKGNIQNFLTECNYRCLLFDNKTKDDLDQQKQLQKLLDLTDQTDRYSLNQFLSAEKERKSLEEEISSPILAQEASMFVSDMQTKLKSLEDEWTGSNKEKLDLLSKYQEELQTYESSFSNKHFKPGKYLNPFDSINLLKQNIQTKLKLVESEILLENFNESKNNLSINDNPAKASTTPEGKSSLEKSESCYYNPTKTSNTLKKSSSLQTSECCYDKIMKRQCTICISYCNKNSDSLDLVKTEKGIICTKL
ncbi:AIG protein [Biomphalaria glabrata]|nr:AIG protein [Biomphalaria glabrata]